MGICVRPRAVHAPKPSPHMRIPAGEAQTWGRVEMQSLGAGRRRRVARSGGGGERRQGHGADGPPERDAATREKRATKRVSIRVRRERRSGRRQETEEERRRRRRPHRHRQSQNIQNIIVR